jgi:GNAT superfamily N-acetyltransferase
MSSRPLARHRIRPFGCADAALIERVFDGLGPRSRYLRFHGPKPRLTASDRAYLAGADGRDHLGLVALSPDGEPLGLARCVRLNEDPAAAELAAEVVDSWQRRGIGSSLVVRLARRAAGVGIERLVANVLADTALPGTLLRHGWCTTATDGPTVTLEAPVWTVARGGLGRS